MKKLQNWWQFTKERFEPRSHITMIIVFLAAHILIANSISSAKVNFTDILLLFIGVLSFYFKLRLYDEVKDFDLDVIINQHRPLPRGLLHHRDMYIGMILCIFIEILTFSSRGTAPLLAMILAISYSLIMFKEFFMAEKIRPYLTSYALIHTIVTTFLSFAIFSFLTKMSLFEVVKNPSLLFFSLANWLLFNIFEFGRKTFASSEERLNVDTYSSLFGRTGAVILVATQALMAHFLSLYIVGTNLKILFPGFAILLLLLTFLSIRYIVTDHQSAAKHYRVFSSIYIVVFYIIIIFSLLLS